MADSEVEQTLFVCREAVLYKIPPRSSGGHKSGDWLVSDKIFTGRVRVIAKGEIAEVRIEDPSSGDLFAMCPVAPGQRALAVEPVIDSSRGFVLRLVDPTSGRHAFIGLMFGDRNDAFDFNVALSDHEKHLQRDKDVAAARGGKDAGPAAASAAAPSPEVAALYRRQDLSLKDGETIKIQVKAPAAKAEAGGRSGGSFLAQLGSTGGPQAGGATPPTGAGALLAPPPQPTPSAAPAGRPARGPAAAAEHQGSQELLGLGAPTTVAAVAGAAQALEGFEPFGGKSKTTATSTDSWATFE
ncbi:hypothetical protein WJX81_000793 [Elliptochloris bilobata]|uniref:NECAP PHear domain-containing protein n=1 Tax=Elliptochloris bilobata TaxID=381761 RepID=A0AAW1RM52_9CHLO